jgi:hypothetical protein
LLRYRLLWDLLLLRSGPHPVNEHTSQRASGRVKNTRLHSFSNLLLVAAVVLGNLLRSLKAVSFGFHLKLPRLG